jgi:predicted transcriptional regulator
MIDEQKIVKTLKALGLSDHEANAYFILSTRGPLTAVETADATNIPRPRIYDILKNLDRSGFVHVQWGKPTRYIPVSPEKLVEVVRKESEKSKEDRKKASMEFVKLVEPVYGRTMLPGDLSYMINGADNVVEQGKNMLASAKRASFVAPHDPTGWLLDKSRHRRCNGRIRVMGHAGPEDVEGIEVKIFPVAKESGVLIVDEKECLFLISDDKLRGYERAILVKNTNIASAYEQFFDLVWKSL